MDRPETLNDLFVEAVETPGRYGDGRGGYGLSLLVKLSVKGGVTKSFAQRVRIDNVPHNLGLGPYPAVSLQEARAMAKANYQRIRRRRVNRTLDALLGAAPAVFAPVPAPAPVRPVPTTAALTVREAAEQVIAVNRANWRAGGKSEKQWRASLDDYVFPKLGNRPVSDVTCKDVMSVLAPIWNPKRETARRVRARLRSILDWAIAQGLRTDNPVHAVSAALPKNGVKVRHHAALPFAQVGAALAKVRESRASLPTRLALELLILTAGRSGEIRGARWEEFDYKTATWTIPASRMKSGREHRVPLSRQAVECAVNAGHELFDGRGLMFPGRSGGPLSDMTLSKALKTLDLPATPHGFRSSFRDWAAECSDAPREVCELALAHVEGSQAERAYRRTDLFDQRRELMQAWADYVGA